MRRFSMFVLGAVLGTTLITSSPTQDMWIAGWGSRDIMRVSPGGVIERHYVGARPHFEDELKNVLQQLVTPGAAGANGDGKNVN